MNQDSTPGIAYGISREVVPVGGSTMEKEISWNLWLKINFVRLQILKFARLEQLRHSIVVYRMPIGAKNIFPAPNSHLNVCQDFLYGHPPLIKTNAM